jgi:hypothetical protein
MLQGSAAAAAATAAPAANRPMPTAATKADEPMAEPARAGLPPAGKRRSDAGDETKSEG